MIKGILPDAIDNSPKAICVMLYDWKNNIGRELLDSIEKVFLNFNLAPHEGTGSLGEKCSQGNYSRTRKKLAEFLDGKLDEMEFRDVRILSEKIYEKEDPFCPSKLGVVWASGARKNKMANFYIRADEILDSALFIQYIEENIFTLTGEFYGGAWEFPAAFGPNSYLASIVAAKRLEQKPNPEYGQRITRWRDNVYKGLYPREGYFREIYPINYITSNHLNVPFLGRTLGHFMESNGELKVCAFNSNMYRWDLPKDHCEHVRDLLEPSGFVLSSSGVPGQFSLD